MGSHLQPWKEPPLPVYRKKVKKKKPQSTTMYRSVNQIYEMFIPSKNKGLFELYLTLFLRTLAFTIIGVFVPLYMIRELNFTIPKTLFFFIIFDLSMLIFTPIGAKLTHYIGVKHTILLSFPFHIAYIIMLGLMKPFPALYYSAPVLSGIANGLFWIGFHSEFSKDSDNKNSGKEVSLLFAIPLVVGIIGPLLGAFIATQFGFNILYTISSALLALAAFPFMLAADNKTDGNIKLGNVFKNPLKDLVGYISYGMRDYASILLWPIFIFFILGTYIAIGSLGSAIAFVNVIFSIFIGKVSDRINKTKLLKIASIIDSGTWTIRHLFKGILTIFGVTAVSAFATLAMYIPFTALTYDKINRHNKMEYLIFRELGLCIGRILILSAAIIMPLEYAFFIIAVSNLLLFFF